MSSKRLNKRQLREQQELDELADAPIPTTSSSAASKKSPFQQLDDEPSDEDDDNDEEEEEQEGKTIQKKPTTTSLFAALGDGADEQDDQDESEPDQDISTQQAPKSSKKKNKKKKKKAAAAAADSPQANPEAADLGQDAQPKSTSTGTKKSSKKKPATSSVPAAAKSKDVSEMSIDEFDALLASQSSLNDASTKGSNPASSSSSTTTTLNRVSAFRTHLSLDPRNLDPAIELRRQFGSAAIKAYQNEAASSSSSGRATSGARARAQANNPNLKVRSLLCTPKDHWPPISRSFTGMSMDVLDSPTHGRICAWKHSKAYRQVQMQFLQAVRSYDPNALMALLRVYPFHIDTLLQLSEYSRHQGDLGQAADFNDRALFALERCASPYFTSCLSSTTSGPPLVNFNKIENRAFYLAIHRNIGFLGRRGTWRTALEWAKLLLGLGQDGEDHHAALLWIDFLAIKSRQHRWLLDLIHKLDEQRSRASAAPGGGVSHVQDLSVPARTIVDAADKEPAGEGAHYSGTLDWCVGLAYSRALALRAIEKEEGDKTGTRSNAALRLAIARFPAAVPLLCSKAGIELPSKLAGHAAFQLRTRFDPAHDTLPDLLTHIYVLRSDSLWKEPGYAEWLRSTAMALADALVTDFELGSKRKSAAAVAALTTRRGIYRHVLVSDVPDTVRQQLVAYLPPEITASSAQMDAFDPVPPSARAGVLGSPSTHIDAEVEHVTRYDDEYFAPIMTELSSTRSRGATEADARAGGMMHALRRALAGLGGVHGWDAALDAMDDETRQDVLAQVMHMAQAAQQQGAEGGMPGAFAVAEEEAEMAAARPGAFAAIRAAMDAIWGGGGGQRDDEEE
ncbi:uncharacterized protein SRS1_16791 [Sporisorium reilianum f. sp. reilianum]|uniref:Transcription factor 25 n=1 Tax=Sporisorium reilianum f. sp. reilianum TaxID=72559 RepID=A0A2N8UPI9_9BASI|nr:uncharacterized protein SRS1_16791 [Sporisorium reilianum f. sp. reilianum]